LSDWFGVTPGILSNVLLQSFPIPPIFRKSTGVEENTVAGSLELLGQNYPNPVTRSTTITFGSAGGITTIQLFDASGRLVRTLVQQEFSRGTQSITVDRGQLPAGNYFYRLSNGGNSATRQMVVVD